MYLHVRYNLWKFHDQLLQPVIQEMCVTGVTDVKDVWMIVPLSDVQKDVEQDNPISMFYKNDR